MTLQQIIENVTPAGWKFYHGEREWQNMFSDENENEPIQSVYLDEPIVTDYKQFTSGLIQEEYSVSLVILKKSQLEMKPEDRLPIMEDCRTTARKIISNLMAYEEIKNITGSRSLGFYNLFDANCDGVFLTFKITPYNYLPVC